MNHQSREIIKQAYIKLIEELKRRNQSDDILNYLCSIQHFEERWIQVELGNILYKSLNQYGYIPWLEFKHEDIAVYAKVANQEHWAIELKVTKNNSINIPWLNMALPQSNVPTDKKYLLIISYYCYDPSLDWTESKRYPDSKSFFAALQNNLHKHLNKFFPNSKLEVLGSLDSVANGKCPQVLDMSGFLISPIGMD